MISEKNFTHHLKGYPLFFKSLEIFLIFVNEEFSITAVAIDSNYRSFNYSDLLRNEAFLSEVQTLSRRRVFPIYRGADNFMKASLFILTWISRSKQ